MASDTATAKADPAPGLLARLFRFRLQPWPWGGSRLGRLLITLNLVGVLILVIGSLVLNELRQGLLHTRLDSLTAQGELIANVIAELDTRGDPQPSLEASGAQLALQKTFVPRGQRARLYDSDSNLLADSYLISDAVEVSPLPPARTREQGPPKVDRKKIQERIDEGRKAVDEDVKAALTGKIVGHQRASESGEQVVSVAIPIQRVKGVVGALVLEAGDVDKIVADQRKAILPFIFVALGVNILSGVLLHMIVVRPVQRLSAAADQVRLQQARAISLPDVEERNDEIGDLARSLETMTATLSNRMDAIERFAADVSHEIKNPLTSVRSAVETLELVKDPDAKARLLALLKQDVRRMDRLITDISNASRLDAELSRESPRPADVHRLLEEIAGLYDGSLRPGEPTVRFVSDPEENFYVLGREGPLGQVFRNLIDNARSFSAPDGEVRVRIEHDPSEPATSIRVSVEDDGPGVPAENLETIFERFYTSRPRGTAFGGNSGLGLSIARQIVLAHGGKIWAENRMDQRGRVLGARFVVLLPEAPGARG